MSVSCLLFACLISSTLPSGDRAKRDGSQCAHTQKRHFDERIKRRIHKILLSNLAQGAEAGKASERQ